MPVRHEWGCRCGTCVPSGVWQNFVLSLTRSFPRHAIPACRSMAPGNCPDCNREPCRNPKRVLDDCCACSGEVCGDSQCPAIDAIVCERCGRGDREQALLLCDGCDHACHLDCMPTPWTSLPALWFCQRCKRAVIEKRRRTGSVGAALLDPGPSSQPWGSMPQEPRLATGSWLGGLAADSASWPSQHVAEQRVALPLDALAGSTGFTKQSVNPDIMRRVDATKSKTCNCRKSRCLKQYCECYREKEWCSNRCNCQDCLNLPGEPLCSIAPSPFRAPLVWPSFRSSLKHAVSRL